MTTMTTNTASFTPTRIGAVDFVNLTPHNIVFRDEQGADHTIPPSGQVARIGTTTVPSHIDSLRLFSRVDAEHPTGWQQFAIWVQTAQAANPESRIVGIVSGMFLDGLRQPQPCIDDELVRWLLHHLVSPLTDGTAIRDDKGHIVAVRGFRTEVLPWEFRHIGLAPAV